MSKYSNSNYDEDYENNDKYVVDTLEAKMEAKNIMKTFMKTENEAE